MITNNLTFDPPTRLRELTQNWIRSFHGHSTPSLKISCKSVQPFCRNVADKETNKETKKERKKSLDYNTIPRPLPGRGNNIVQTFWCISLWRTVVKLQCIKLCAFFLEYPEENSLRLFLLELWTRTGQRRTDGRCLSRPPSWRDALLTSFTHVVSHYIVADNFY